MVDVSEVTAQLAQNLKKTGAFAAGLTHQALPLTIR
jgi:hypothetical protein